MRFVLFFFFVSLSSASFAQDLWTKDYQVDLLEEDQTRRVVVTLTDVAWDNHCGFHATRITRNSFYWMLRRAETLRDVIIEMILPNDPNLAEDMREWFDDINNPDSDRWLDTAGLHLMANLFDMTITTYGFRYIGNPGEPDFTTITQTAVYQPLPALRQLLFENGITYPGNAQDIEIFNNEGLHWQRIVVPQIPNQVAQPLWNLPQVGTNRYFAVLLVFLSAFLFGHVSQILS